MNNDELAVAARDAAEGSYSPYSHFRVGAVVVSVDGEIFTGANVENASYPVSSCAESTAINTAVSRGVREIASIAVACIDAEDIEGAYPCGRCRQEMAEFGVEKVIVTAGDGSVIREHTLEELLPHQFNL
jgi:cytidine deaminase